MKRIARGVFAVLLLLAIVLLLEASSWIAWRLTEGTAFSYREAAAMRAHQASAAADAEPPPEPAGGAEPDPFQHGWLGGHLSGMVLHPFLGYVYSPEYNEVEERNLRPLVVTDDGFFTRREPLPPPSDRPLRVGVFGGSVAMIFSFDGTDTLVAGLEPLSVGRGVVVESYALGGYKQPQQLMTLAWLIATGQAPDVVINLDGFNEVTLPPTENLRRGVNPYYPRAWEQRVTVTPDPRKKRLEGEVVYLEARRAELARAFSRPALRWSVTWNYLWRWLDRRADLETADAMLRLAAYRPPDQPWVAHGPAYRPAGRAGVIRDLTAAWERSSLAMHDLAAGAGLRYHHFLQPNQYVPGSKPLAPRELKIAYREDHRFRELVADGYPALREAGRRLVERGVDFHDLTQLFESERRPVYNDDCCHLNRLGNELVAQAVVAAIVASASDEASAAADGAPGGAGR